MDYKLEYKEPNYVEINSIDNKYKIDESGTKEVDHNLQLSHLNTNIKEIVFQNFSIRYGSIFSENNRSVDFEYEGDSIVLNFILKGCYEFYLNSMNSVRHNNENTHNILYCKHMKGKINWKCNESFTFEVCLQPSFFVKFLPNEKLFDVFTNHISKNVTAYLSNLQMVITPQMLQIIQQIIHCPYQDSFRVLHIESRILSLVLLQIEHIQILNFSGKDGYSRIDSHTKDKMYYAKELIEHNIRKPLSLSTLSHKLNTNECSLKKNFKNTFGSTVFGYITQLKMEEAKELILDKSMTIQQISLDLGYKHPQHFSTAFKKYWGASPSQIV